MMKFHILLRMVCILDILLFSGCSAGKAQVPEPAAVSEPTSAVESETVQKEDMQEVSAMHMRIDDTEVSVTWEENTSVEALQALAQEGPITFTTHEYGGFEQVGSIGADLPTNDTRITTEPGDIVLYLGSEMSINYGSNAWFYTRLGKITGLTDAELTELLSGGKRTVELWME